MKRHLLLGRLQSRWAAVSEGAVAVHMIRGDPGIGKTSLLRELGVRIGDRARVVQGRGGDDDHGLRVAAEAAKPHRLNRSLDPLGAADALVRSWSRQTRSEPLALVIDDVHDLDPSSRTALSVALRRFDGQRLLVVVAGRPGAELERFAEGFDLVDLAGLDEEDARQVLGESAPFLIADTVVDRLLGFAAGNPLALRSLPRALTREQLAGEHPLPEPMVLWGDLRILLTRPLADVSPAARELLELVMVSIDGEWSVLQPLAGVGADLALAELERAGLVSIAESRVEPFHPLLRDAVRGGLDAPRRRELAAALAEAPGLDPTQRLTYLSHAVVGHSAPLAGQLAEAAERALRRKAPDAAAVLFERAARVAPPGEGGAAVRLRAAEALALAGESARGRARLSSLLENDAAVLTEEQVVQAETLLAALECVGGDPARARSRLEGMVDRVPVARRATVLAALSIPLGIVGDVPALLTTTERALAEPPASTGIDSALRVVRAHALSAVDEGAGAAMLAEVVPSLDVRSAVRVDPLFGLHVGRAFGYAERYAEGARLMTALIAGARRYGARTTLAMAHGALADIRLRSSRLDDAHAQLDEAIAVSLGAGQRAFAPFWLGMRARIAGYRGDEAAAAADLALGYRIADDLGGEGSRYYLDCHAGVVAATTGKWRAAIEHLERARHFERAAGGLTPQVARWSVELVEAYSAMGDGAARDELVADLTEASRRRGARRWTRATASIASALVERDRDPARSAALAADAAEMLRLDDDRLDRIRARIVQLRALRAAGVDSTPEVRAIEAEVRHGLAALRLRPWASRWEHDRAHPVAHAPTQRTPSTLTSAEARVLAEVARGLGNQQIAARLGISAKTVANHLYRIYGKLGVSSRTEATRRYLIGDEHQG